MNDLLEELRALDWRDPGRWPLPVLVAAVAATFVLLTAGFSYFFVWQNLDPDLQRYEAEEHSLRDEFRHKHSKAVNLEIYKEQLDNIERSFGALLRQLPGKTEVPNLLIDISQTGLAAGLEEKLFQPGAEVKRDFYAELPIRIRLSGSYHEFGAFVSGIAALPRIVTLHNIEIKPETKDSFDQLTLDLTAKTYRYLDEDELAAADADRKKQEKSRRPRSGHKT